MTQQSDLILAVGMRFSDRVTGDVKNYAPHAKIIHIDIDSAELGKNLPVELPIHADAGEALEAMKSGIRHKDRSAWIDVAKGCDRREYEVVVRRAPIRRAVYFDVRRGQHAGRGRKGRRGDRHGRRPASDVQRPLFEVQSTRSFITSGGLGTMGFGLPAAMGAKLGVPDREVVW